jgi:Na+/melibiose symporter-like transporter
LQGLQQGFLGRIEEVHAFDLGSRPHSWPAQSLQVTLAGTSYVPNLPEQNADVLNAIRQAVALAPAATFFAAFLIMLWYPLSDRGFLEMLREIERRRRAE